MRPVSAATAGSRLIKILNIFAGIFRSACISRVNGMALESKASAIPGTSIAGLRRISNPSPRAMGNTRREAKIIPMVTAFPVSMIREIRWPSMIYAAQNAPASNASKTPITSKPLLPHGVIRAMPAAVQERCLLQ